MYAFLLVSDAVAISLINSAFALVSLIVTLLINRALGANTKVTEATALKVQAIEAQTNGINAKLLAATGEVAYNRGVDDGVAAAVGVSPLPHREGDIS